MCVLFDKMLESSDTVFETSLEAADCPIHSVTVFSDRAEISRTVRSKVAEGESPTFYF